MSTDGLVISELISKYGEYGARRIVQSARNYFWDQDRKKEEKDTKEIVENPIALAYIEHFKSWVNAEAKKVGYEMFETKDRLDFESYEYDIGWYSIVNLKFEYGICLAPKDLKISFLTFERKKQDFIWNLPYKFNETHQPLRYVELSKDNQYGSYLDLIINVFDYNPSAFY